MVFIYTSYKVKSQVASMFILSRAVPAGCPRNGCQRHPPIRKTGKNRAGAACIQGKMYTQAMKVWLTSAWSGQY